MAWILWACFKNCAQIWLTNWHSVLFFNDCYDGSNYCVCYKLWILHGDKFAFLFHFSYHQLEMHDGMQNLCCEIKVCFSQILAHFGKCMTIVDWNQSYDKKYFFLGLKPISQSLSYYETWTNKKSSSVPSGLTAATIARTTQHWPLTHPPYALFIWIISLHTHTHAFLCTMKHSRLSQTLYNTLWPFPCILA